MQSTGSRLAGDKAEVPDCQENAMMEVLLSLPAFSEPLAFGCLGVLSTLIGSVLRSGLDTTPRRIGSCFCAFGLALMAIGFICITSETSILTYAQRG